MVAAFAGIFQILVKMWGAQSEQRGPGSRGGSWRRRRASQGRSRACYGRVLSTCRGGRRRRHKLRTGVENSLVLLWFL